MIFENIYNVCDLFKYRASDLLMIFINQIYKIIFLKTLIKNGIYQMMVLVQKVVIVDRINNLSRFNLLIWDIVRVGGWSTNTLENTSVSESECLTPIVSYTIN